MWSRRDGPVGESQERASKDRRRRIEPDDEDDATTRELGESSQWVRLQREVPRTDARGPRPDDSREGMLRSQGRTSRDRRRRTKAR